MNKSAQELLSEALVLPAGDRAAIAAELIESLDPGSDTDLAQAWETELAARIAALDRGEVHCVDWSSARQMISGDGDA